MLARAGAVDELTQLADQVLELPALDQHYAAESRAGPAPPRAPPVRARLRAHRSRRRRSALLEAGGARAEAELVAGQVLSLLRAGVRGGEIAVVYRSARQVAPTRVARVRPVRDRAQRAAVSCRCSHTPLGRALRGAARCALLDERQARAGGPAGLSARARAAGPSGGRRPARGRLLREGLRQRGGARARILGWRLAEIDELSDGPRPRRRSCARSRAALLAAPHRRTAPVLERRRGARRARARDAHASPAGARRARSAAVGDELSSCSTS